MKRDDHHLVQRVLDGDITREAFDGFQQQLRDDPKLAKLYEEYALLHHTLSEEFEDEPVPDLIAAGATRRLPAFAVLWIFAVLAAVVALLWWFRPWNDRAAMAEVAAVTFSADAVWQIEGTTHHNGDAACVTKGCVLVLRQGRANIAWKPAVTAVVEGPAELTFSATDSLALNRGRGFFRCGETHGGLTLGTPRLTAAGSGAEFGIEVSPSGPDEVHVAAGKVGIVSKSVNESMTLSAGSAARVAAAGRIAGIPPDTGRFATALGRFHPVVSGPFEKNQWRLDYGNPSIAANRIEGVNYSVFLRLPEPEPAGGNTVLLVTLEVAKPAGGEFHTDGWAGMSFFSGGNEVLFFGDSYGTRQTWSLDVKQRIPVILPEHAVAGPKTVSLRYDMRSGEVSLHEGAVPLNPPFCEGKLPPGTRFDEIRIGASSGASLTVNSLLVRVGGE